jgi:hypothetical protein
MVSGELGVPESQARPKRIAAILLLIVLLGGFPYLSVEAAKIALHISEGALWLRLSLWTIAAFLMAIPVWLAFVMLRRKITTGRFLLNRTESAALRAERLSRMGAGKPFWPQAGIWVAPLLFSAFFLCLGVLAIGGAISFGPSAWKPFVALLVLAALFLFIPSQMIFKAVRRKLRTGNYLPSEEELAAARSRCGNPQPLWQRVLVPSLMLLNAVLQTSTAVRRFHGGHGSFGYSVVIACLWWAMSAIWIWRGFRPQQCAIPVESQPSSGPQSRGN